MHGANELKPRRIVYSVIWDQPYCRGLLEFSNDSVNSVRAESEIYGLWGGTTSCQSILEESATRLDHEAPKVNPASNTARQLLTTSASKSVPAPAVTSARAISIPRPGR